MIDSDENLTNKPVLSIQAGRMIAKVNYPIIDPDKLTIIAFKLIGISLINPQDSFLMVNDIREDSEIGFIIDSQDEIIESNDVIRLKKLLNKDFDLIDMPVFTKKGKKIGKVESYTIIKNTFMIYQIIIKRPFLKSLFDEILIINRNNIIDVKDNKIIIKDEYQKITSIGRKTNEPGFINPFRKNKKSIQAIKE